MPEKNHEALYDLASSHWIARSLHVIAEAGVADVLNETPLATKDIAAAAKCDEDALFRILRLLASQGIFEFEGGKWRHTQTSRLLREDHPQSLRAYVRMI